MASPLATDLGVRRLLHAAGQAPSVYNTQPWRFQVIRQESIELLTDPGRRLKVSDPRGRSQLVSCGAALFNLRMAIRVAGERPLVKLRPSMKRPELLASIKMGGAGAPTGEERDLYDCIPLRRTNRQPFSERRIPLWVMAELQVAATWEGAALVPADPRQLLEHAVMAGEALDADSDYLAELDAWTMPGMRQDGVPGYLHGPRPSGELPATRDFGRRESCVPFEQLPQVAVLTTPGDRPIDWLRAGQALQRVLLVATAHGISASFLNQPLDLRDMRHRADPRHRRGHPQMIMRLGYGPEVPRAPRRPPTELEIGRTELPHQPQREEALAHR